MARHSALPRALAGLGIAALLIAMVWLAAGEVADVPAPPAALAPDAPADAPAGDAPAALDAAPEAPRDAAPAPSPRREPTALDAPAPATASLRGRVLRAADGSPLAGWSLRPAALDPQPTGAEARPPSLAPVELDAAGRFAFEAAPRALTAVVAEHPRRALGVRLELPDAAFERELELVADTGWILEGVVTSDTGRPLLAAELRQADGTEHPVTEGRFRALDVTPADDGTGAAVLLARAPLHAQVEKRVALDGPARVIDGLLLELPAAGALQGRVLGADGLAYGFERVSLPFRVTDTQLESPRPLPETREPVGADERLPGRGPGAPVSDATLARTEQPVHYRLDHVPPGRYALRVEPTPPPSGPASDVDVAVREQLIALGYLEVSAAADPGSAPENTPEPVASSAHAAPEHWIQELEVRAGEVTRLDLELPWGALLEGRVLDPAGTPLEGSRVRAVQLLEWPFPEAPAGSMAQAGAEFELLQTPLASGGRVARLQMRLQEVRADAQGRYRLERLPPGPLRLHVAAPASAGLRPQEIDLELRAGERHQRDLFLGGGLAVEGRVLDPQGRPLADAYVFVYEPAPTLVFGPDDVVRCDEQGRFRVAGLAPGGYRISANAPGHVNAQRAVEAGGPPLEIVLQPALSVDGVVRHAASGAPLQSFSVTVDRGSSISQRSFETDDGRFVLDDVEAGELTLRVEAAGFVPWSSGPLRPELGEGEGLDVRLEPAP